MMIHFRYTKMGYAGNVEPQYIVPTVIASQASKGVEGIRDGLDDLDFYIGEEAMQHSTTHQINYPIRHGLVENWDHMERLWQRCIFKVRGLDENSLNIMLLQLTFFLALLCFPLLCFFYPSTYAVNPRNITCS